MEIHFFITGTQKELRFLAEYSNVSTPKMWGKEKWIKDNVYKHEVDMRLPDYAQIENGKTYSFKNYLKRTDDLQMIEFIKGFDELRQKYNNGELRG